jgi:uncharacterized protein (DUF433 family)
MRVTVNEIVVSYQLGHRCAEFAKKVPLHRAPVGIDVV